MRIQFHNGSLLENTTPLARCNRIQFQSNTRMREYNSTMGAWGGQSFSLSPQFSSSLQDIGGRKCPFYHSWPSLQTFEKSSTVFNGGGVDLRFSFHQRDIRQHSGSKILRLCRVTMSPLVPKCLACHVHQ